jgi:hypothetical protein
MSTSSVAFVDAYLRESAEIALRTSRESLASAIGHGLLRERPRQLVASQA